MHFLKLNRSTYSAEDPIHSKFFWLLRHFIDEDTKFFDIFKSHNVEGKAESVNINGNTATASTDRTHFFPIDHQENNQIKCGERSGKSFTSFDTLRKEKTSCENTGDENDLNLETELEIDLKSAPLKR